MKRLFLLFILSTMCMLTTFAQHTRKHKARQKAAVVQHVESKTSAKNKGRKTVKASRNTRTATPVTTAKGKRQAVEKVLPQLQQKGKQPQQKTNLPQQKGKQPQVKDRQQPQVKGRQQPQAKTQQSIRGKAAVRNAHAGKKGAKGPFYVTTEEIKGLQLQNQKLQQEISEHEEEMKVKQKDVDDRLQKIVRLDTEIGQHQRTIDTIATDIKGLDSNIGILKGQLASLEAQLGERRARFIRSMRYMARHRSIQDKLMFVFSAKSLTQMYRRLRFVREYAAYQRAQGEQLKAKQMQVDEKHSQLKQVRVDKSNLLYKDRQVHAQMERKRVEQQTVVASLQNDQKVLQGVITQRRQQQQALNAQIDRLIQIEIQKARERAIAEAKAQAAARAAAAKKRAEELARKKAAAEAAARENARRIAEAKEREERAKAAARAAAEAAEKARQEAAARAAAARAAAEKARQEALQKERAAARERAIRKAEAQEAAAKAAQVQAEARAAAEKARADQVAREAEANRVAVERKADADRERAAREAAAARASAAESNDMLSSADRAITGNFANNRGRLPMPLSGKIVSHFGQYNVAGMSNIRLNNDGINIKGAPGSAVRSVFMGEVSGVFMAGGMSVVMVRHGIYISVYANLGSVSVSKGQKVGTGQTIGTVGKTGILQFQLRKETAKLNPEQWLR
ncbi:peptidoglycan DD-metalloendopeptidase family protein [Prevotella fusca JCM 17724]|uniref:Peptidase M23 n=1 Tax=Prevotella fusca JCM 17724 TaxID=1236517 RepID=A0A0K1NHZ5_9BACT|nr:M23 family metallopeptidase [Prevotella fusca]AKU68316.1 peptidase M23 [Prevotella fusca JCM 17724]QUB87255.1 peptidoglycan DD-metalloendopeptidase family protein [Prevotella fusca JCM 17724]